MRRHAISHRLSTCSVLLSLALTPCASVAQATSDRDRARSVVVSVADAAHALPVQPLDTGAGYPAGFRDVDFRVRLQVKAADMLWPHDRVRARAIFERAFKETEALAAPESSRSSYGPDERLELQGSILEIARLHDPALVASLQKPLVAAAPGTAALTIDQKNWSFEAPHRVMELAVFLSKVDPPAAAVLLGRIGPRDSLDNRLWSEAVSTLGRSHPARARELVVCAIDGPSERHFLTLVSLAALVFPQRALVSGELRDSYTGPSEPSTAFDAVVAKHFLETFLRDSRREVDRFEVHTAQLRSQDPSPSRSRELGMLLEDLGYVYSYITSLEWEFARFAPSSLALQRLEAIALGALVPQLADMLAIEALRDETQVAFWLAGQYGTASERARRMAALEPKLPLDPENRQYVHAEIAQSALRAYDFEMASSYAEKSGNRYPADIDATRALHASVAANAGQYDLALCLLDQIASERLRDRTCLDIGAVLAERGERAQALVFLNRPRTVLEAESAVLLAKSLATIEPERAFVLLAKAIEDIGTLDEHRSEGFAWRPTLADAFASLARIDFTRARTIADGVRADRLRLVCQLATARGALVAPASSR